MTLSGRPLQILRGFSLIALVLLSCLMGCGLVTPPLNIPPQEPNVVSLDPGNWYIYYSSGMPAHPSADTEGAWSFEFPGDGGHVNYVQTPFNATMTPHRMSMTFKVESNAPQYEVLDPGDHLPATIRLFFEQQGDDLKDPNGRWWADAKFYNLGSQDGDTITFMFPLTSDQWTNVYGQQDQQAFTAALANVGWVGLTCGGQYFAGHGVALRSGNAKFVLVHFQVN
jgi:uncharacterized protein YndB with AHSA1/START domain